MTEIYLESLAMTLVLELALAWLWGVTGRDLLLVTLMNVLTNPLVVTWHYSFMVSGFFVNTILPECGAVAVECFLLFRFGRAVRSPILLGILLNLFSYCAGTVIFFIF